MYLTFLFPSIIYNKVVKKDLSMDVTVRNIYANMASNLHKNAKEIGSSIFSKAVNKANKEDRIYRIISTNPDFGGLSILAEMYSIENIKKIKQKYDYNKYVSKAEKMKLALSALT